MMSIPVPNVSPARKKIKSFLLKSSAKSTRTLKPLLQIP
jgi:hypothetical protein